MIEVKNLTKKYGDIVAVDNASFEIEKGLIYGFLGSNGAGKSTTMNIITGYLGFDSGEVLINGKNILDDELGARRSIGYLPEQPPLYIDMTVLEYLKFAAELKGIEKQERGKMITKAVKLTNVYDVKDRLIGNLSKGYRQRVGLAQALLGFPEIIILDEPTVGLDPKQIIEIRELIRGLAGEHTIILSSHILSEIQEVCDRVIIINKGRIVACGAPDELERQKNASVLELRIKEDCRETAERILRDNLDVEEFQLSRSGKEYIIAVRHREDADVRECLFFAFAEEGCPLLGIKSSDRSLEQVFLQITAESYGHGEEG